jgi:transcriptional regulator with XRE-family HTH domain
LRVAEEIRAMMARRRVSGAALAAELGVSPAWVSYRLSGKQAIDLNDLERIAAVLQAEVSDLLPRSVPPSNPWSLESGSSVRRINERPPGRREGRWQGDRSVGPMNRRDNRRTHGPDHPRVPRPVNTVISLPSAT